MAIAIDRDLSDERLMSQIEPLGNIYFQPKYLAFKEGFVELLRQKNINYQGTIPFTILISREGKILTKYIGVKRKDYLRNKIIAATFGQ